MGRKLLKKFLEIGKWGVQGVSLLSRLHFTITGARVSSKQKKSRNTVDEEQEEE